MNDSKPTVKCLICGERFGSINGVCDHIDEEHSDQIPKDFTTQQFYYMLKTGKSEGKCVVCGSPTKWNDVTNKYHRFCGNPACKKKYKEEFKKRMIGKYGRAHLLNSPEQQRKMLASRSISGKYRWSDGSAEIPYTGTYELDFLRFLDVFMNFDSDDIMSPSPHTYYYIYEGSEKFYIPDFFIPSLNLEIEIKDGGDNPNNHHKIQGIDKVKEKLKDDVMTSQHDFSYIKIPNKSYGNFFKFLSDAKKAYIENPENNRPIFIVDDEVVVGKKSDAPVLEAVREESSRLLHTDDLKRVAKDFADKNMYPVYVLLTYTGTAMSKIIKFVTKEPYSHISISFDTSMQELYSFGRKTYDDDMKFIKESIKEGIMKDTAADGRYSLYVMFVTKEEHEMMRKKLDEFIAMSDKLKYSLKGLFNFILGRETTDDGEYFCSQFVAEIIRAGRETVFSKHPSLYSPYQIIKTKPFKFVSKGSLVNYNEEAIKEKVYSLFSKFRLDQISKEQNMQ